MTDEQLMLLEMLTYGLNGSIARAAGIGNVTGDTVEDWMNHFTEDRLAELEGQGDNVDGSYLSGKEWAAIIRQIQSDEQLMDLNIRNIDDNVHAMCFEDMEGNAYVAFKGTSGGDEWYDNVEGLNSADTKSQKEAQDYIEDLPYDHITVVGHSKGGNKAQYVAITSDKVDRCVSMDGQGFSQEFLDKYAAEIEARGGNIKNISLDTDYVHILLFPVPGAEQIYCKGDESLAGLRNHSPGAYYQYKDGHMVVDENGQPALIFVDSENKGIVYLHEFTCFVLNVMPDDKKSQVVEYLGYLLALTFDDHYTVPGTDYDQSKLLDYILSDPESLSLVLAYLLKYADTYNLTNEELIELIKAFGLMPLFEEMMKALNDLPPIKKVGAATLIGTLYDLIALLRENLRDGEDDPIIEFVFSLIGKALNGKVEGVDLEQLLPTMWHNIDTEFSAIGPVDKRTANNNKTIRSTKIYDYSQQAYDALISTMRSIESLTSGSTAGWEKFSGEEWYGSIGVGIMIHGVNSYFERLSDINSDCKRQIDSVFQNVRTTDQSAGQNITEATRKVETNESQAKQVFA